MIEINLPIRLQSPNIKEHWTKTHKRNKRVAQVIGFSLRTNSDVCRIKEEVDSHIKVAGNIKKATESFKIKIQLIKLGREWDYDNFVYGMKPVRDAACAFFFSNLAPGQADCQKCFDIHYLQQKGGSGIKILIEFIPSSTQNQV
jgi:hypothetical protein